MMQQVKEGLLAFALTILVGVALFFFIQYLTLVG